MIKIGVCVGPDKMEAASRVGFDYVEWGLAGTMEMDGQAFSEAVRRAQDMPIRVEAMNGMLPGSLKITGPSADLSRVRDYLEPAFERMARLGAGLVVFGSGGARGVEAGFPFDAAWRQIADFLRLAGEIAAGNGIRIAIEPLRREECNIINHVSEAMALSALVDLENVGALGDSFHMHSVSEPFSALTQAGNRLFHVHTANPAGRVYPAPADGADYGALFSALKAADYSGRVSVEAGCENFEQDGALALQALRQARDGAQ